MPLKMECDSKWNITKNWNVTQKGMTLKMECHSNGMSLKMECYFKWNITKMEYH